MNESTRESDLAVTPWVKMQGVAVRTARVLIVDDDEETRHVLRLLCDSQELNLVGEAAGGIEAVAIALRERPTLVILDDMMPRLDGEVTAELLRIVVPDAKIVAFSAGLREQPAWADAFLNNERIGEVVPLLKSFIR